MLLGKEEKYSNNFDKKNLKFKFCLKFVCIFFKICLHFLQNLFAFCSKFVCILFKICLYFVQNLFTFCSKSVCILFKFCLHFVQNLFAFCPKKYLFIWKHQLLIYVCDCTFSKNVGLN